MHLRIALEEALDGVFRLVESPRVDQVDGDIRRVVEAVIVDADRRVWCGSLGLAREHRGAVGGRTFGRGRVVPWPAAALVFLATAAGTRIIAPNLGHHSSEALLYTSVLTDAPLFDALIAIDIELASTAQAGGCRLCAGRLDHADYPRKLASGRRVGQWVFGKPGHPGQCRLNVAYRLRPGHAA